MLLQALPVTLGSPLWNCFIDCCTVVVTRHAESSGPADPSTNEIWECTSGTESQWIVVIFSSKCQRRAKVGRFFQMYFSKKKKRTTSRVTVQSARISGPWVVCEWRRKKAQLHHLPFHTFFVFHFSQIFLHSLCLFVSTKHSYGPSDLSPLTPHSCPLCAQSMENLYGGFPGQGSDMPRNDQQECCECFQLVNASVTVCVYQWHGMPHYLLLQKSFLWCFCSSVVNSTKKPVEYICLCVCVSVCANLC